MSLSCSYRGFSKGNTPWRFTPGLFTPWLFTPALFTPALFIASLLLALCTTPVAAIEFQAQWGFGNNLVHPQQFAPLRVEVHNDSTRPVQLVLKLERSWGAFTTGVPHVTQFYLAPDARRRVLFYVRVQESGPRCKLAWHPAGDPFAGDVWHVPDPVLSLEPIVVALGPSTSFWSPPSGIPGFRAEYLPDNVSEYCQLDAIIVGDDLELSPRQIGAMQQWVHSGGVLTFVKRGDRLPTLSQHFAATRPGDSHPVGHGYVAQSTLALHELSANTMRNDNWYACFDTAPVVPRGPTIDSLKMVQTQPRVTTPTLSDVDASAALLRSVSTPPPWGLISFLAFLYFLAVVPVNFAVARRTQRTTTPLLFLIVTTILFSFAFYLVGSQGVSTDRHASYTVATPVQPDTLDEQGNTPYRVDQYWVTLATSSRVQRYSHGDRKPLYDSLVSDHEIPGVVTDEALRVEIPLYSSQSFGYRGTLSAPPLFVKTPSFSLSPRDGLKLENLELTPPFSEQLRTVILDFSGPSGRNILRYDPRTALTHVAQGQPLNHYSNNTSPEQWEQQLIHDLKRGMPGSVCLPPDLIDAYFVFEESQLFAPQGLTGEFKGLTVVKMRLPLERQQ